MTSGRLKYLVELEKLLHESQDTAWSATSVREMLDDVTTCISQLQNGEEVDSGSVHSWLYPTSDMQEIAIANGWGNDFLRIANQLESLDKKKPDSL